MQFLAALEHLVAGIPLSKLSAASAELTESYRREERSPFHLREALLAYLLVRMPATYAAVHRALAEVQNIPTTLLDVGAGPGTATWAARDFFPEVRARLVERSGEAIAIGRELGLEGTWEEGDLARTVCRGEDLTLLSYVLAESAAHSFLEEWHKSGGLDLLIVEPGTPRGYQRILGVRSWALSKKLHLVAPCPHTLKCPLEGTEQWCHFSVRVPRSRLHRQIKGGALGHEDEKFSYLLISKKSVVAKNARLVGSVRVDHGRLTLPLCTEGRFEQRVILKRDPQYKAAKKLTWGDAM